MWRNTVSSRQAPSALFSYARFCSCVYSFPLTSVRNNFFYKELAAWSRFPSSETHIRLNCQTTRCFTAMFTRRPVDIFLRQKHPLHNLTMHIFKERFHTVSPSTFTSRKKSRHLQYNNENILSFSLSLSLTNPCAFIKSNTTRKR
jgi:hypothetical protein